jgi:hypothetical protein
MKVLCMFEHGSEGHRVRDGIMIECDRSAQIESTFKKVTGEQYLRPQLTKALPQCGFVPFPKFEAGVATL